jgi:predicted SAM-dependent methyltransferase
VVLSLLDLEQLTSLSGQKPQQSCSSRRKDLRWRLTLKLNPFKAFRHSSSSEQRLTPSIGEIALQNLQIAKEPLVKLNLGCGQNLREDYINIDVVEPSSDSIYANDKKLSDFRFIKSDITSLAEFGNNVVDEIRCDFVLEHIHIDRLPDFIFNMCRVLKVGGKLLAQVPNAEYYAKAILDFCREEPTTLSAWGKYRKATFELLNPALTGILTLGPGAAHASLWTAKSAKFLLESEGFSVETWEDEEVTQGSCTLMIVATKVRSPHAEYTRPHSESSPGRDPREIDSLNPANIIDTMRRAEELLHSETKIRPEEARRLLTELHRDYHA